MSQQDFRITDPVEALVVEQALAMVRDVKRTCATAPYGKVLAHVELVTLERGRELMRKTLEAVVNEQAQTLEKKGRVADNVLAAKAPANTKAKPGGK